MNIKDNAPRLSAAVLAGGKSSRMGQDKALLPLVAGGKPMLQLVLERLAGVADDLMVVANDGGRYEHFGVRVVPDAHAECGALGGIHAAVSAATHEHCMVVACDMPFLDAGLLAEMARRPRQYDALVPILRGESRQGRDGFVYQTLHAIYGKGCLGAINERIGQGQRQVIGFFPDILLETIPEDEVRQWDPSLRSFFNANTPEALATAARLAGGTSGTA